MSLTCQHAARRCLRSLRTSSSPLRPISAAGLVQARNSKKSRRWASTEAAAATNPKIVGIVDQISQLTLLETADLVASLKTRLNIPDMPMGGFMASGPAAPAPAAAEEEEAPVQAEKTMFNLKLQSFEATAKPKIIKEIKSLLGLSLVDSKKFVESAPKMMKEGVTKEEGEKIMADLKALGGVVVME